MAESRTLQSSARHHLLYVVRQKSPQIQRLIKPSRNRSAGGHLRPVHGRALPAVWELHGGGESDARRGRSAAVPAKGASEAVRCNRTLVSRILARVRLCQVLCCGVKAWSETKLDLRLPALRLCWRLTNLNHLSHGRRSWKVDTVCTGDGLCCFARLCSKKNLKDRRSLR